MGNRRKAREMALKVLYTAEVGKISPGEAWDISTGGEEPRGASFAKRLVFGTHENIEFIDSLIEKYAKNWTPSRIALVDKSIMRMALFEINFEEDIPAVVSINEAVDLAKKYSTERSHKFVNGILDAASDFFKKEKSS